MSFSHDVPQASSPTIGMFIAMSDPIAKARPNSSS